MNEKMGYRHVGMERRRLLKHGLCLKAFVAVVLGFISCISSTAEASEIIPTGGIWKSADNVLSMYLQKYQTGSCVIVVTMGDGTYTVFLDSSYSDGISCSNDVDNHQYSLNLALTDTTHGSLTVQLTGLGQVVTAVELKFPEEQPKTIRNSLGMIFSYIPPGSFTMGSLGTEPGREGDEVPHEVTLTKGFYLQTTEVTQRQWKAIMGANPSYFSRCGDSCPVETVTWEDVHAFIDQLNARGEGTYRLPTEAEWEYAARAGSTTAFANGVISELECGVDPNLNAMGWYCGNAANTTHPVAQKESNGWGLYDMHGNVWEWCEDWYADYPAGSVTDPTGPSEGSYRVVRGGSGFFNAEYCRSAGRYFLTPEALGIDLGLRLVRVAP